jgi:adenine phosphoribosyltransferase
MISFAPKPLFLQKHAAMTQEIDVARLRESIRNIPDFPRKGIQFKDLTTLIKQPDLLGLVIEKITSHFGRHNISKVVAIESRGFITGGALAFRLGAGFVPVRKPGKLPANKYTKTYDLEYGTDTLEIHKDALQSNDVVLLHDDLLATGGTSLAAIELIRKFQIQSIYISFIVELDFLKGREKLSPPFEVHSLIHL